ncbi:peptidase M76 family-domain-containing protein [Papiliotrema laurentii]|uniref:Mitochondrial inner membrane protease ATP23 n=1 Tax=Papiliotrema laurentii TaxID=5418 RepID=A0AAD9FVX9_PAPLA|nr:peptidase M76 family-domain-containing protein [Papiliotrema laurentii]
MSSSMPATTPVEGQAPTTNKDDGAFEDWRSSMSTRTGLGKKNPADLTPEQAAQEAEAERKVLERDWNRCEKWKKALMTNSPMVTFLLKHLELSGSPFNSSAIQCHPCPETTAGGFSPDHGILLCQNRFFSKRHMEDTLSHELIHAYDHARFDINWQNLRHHACSEIRAGNLSGDCRWLREMRRGFYGFSKQHQACVKRRAALSVMGNPSCENREMAERAVNEVWESCSKDTRPFDEIY